MLIKFGAECAELIKQPKKEVVQVISQAISHHPSEMMMVDSVNPTTDRGNQLTTLPHPVMTLEQSQLTLLCFKKKNA